MFTAGIAVNDAGVVPKFSQLFSEGVIVSYQLIQSLQG